MHHIIYVPGLGDQNGATQTKLINKWKKLGVVPYYFLVGWNNAEPFKSKLNRLISQIDELSNKDSVVSLVGTSAGAGMALNAYMARPEKINAVVYICGELTGFAKINPKYFEANPAFKDSMALANSNLSKLTARDKVKMLTIHPLFDDIVPINEATIPGVKNKTVFSVQHVITIGLVLTVYKRIAINFLKKAA